MALHKFILVAALAASSLLAGCEHIFTNEEQRFSEYREKCERIGFALDTPENANCVMEFEKVFMQRQAQNPASSGGGMDMLCREALARGDSGAAMVHCD